MTLTGPFGGALDAFDSEEDDVEAGEDDDGEGEAAALVAAGFASSAEVGVAAAFFLSAALDVDEEADDALLVR